MDEPRRLLDEMPPPHKALRSQRLAAARTWAARHGAVVASVWGHFTGAGGREYMVFRCARSLLHFIIAGQDHQGRLILQPFDPENTSNDLPVRAVEEYLGA